MIKPEFKVDLSMMARSLSDLELDFLIKKIGLGRTLTRTAALLEARELEKGDERTR